MEDPQDQITSILLETHRHGGMKDVKSLLRMAIANFACEAGQTKDNPLESPDEAILTEISEAILTPVHLQ
jgi:hypothetical protein